MKHDIFISFSFKDQNVAENLVNYLYCRHGLTCWICTRDIDGGSLYKAKIPEAIDACKVVVFMQSKSSIESREVPKEIGIAFDAEKTIIPFRLDETPLKAELRYDLYGVEYVDATTPTFEDRAEELAQNILKVLGKVPTGDSLTGPKPLYELIPTPFSCSEIFFGRDAEMENLHQAFSVRNTVFLRGMGGIGKSEIAKQYARKYRAEYDRVIFARYDGSLEALIANDAIFNIKGLVKKINADGTQQSDEDYAKVKLNVLNSISDKRTLIILDNFDVTYDPFLDEFASGNNYRLIVTSRLEPGRGKYHVLPIEELNEDVLRDMVIEFANPMTTMIDRNDPDFPELFRMTNRHTLTLELIGNYMEEQCIDEIGDMVALLKKYRITVLENSENTQRAAAIRNLFRMTEMNENEQNFLRWLALTPTEGIGHKVFKEWVGKEVFSARTRLAALSMVRLDGVSKKISLHPIVRQIVQSELKATLENSKPFFDKMMVSVFESWNWPLSQKLMIAESADVIIEQLGEVNNDNFNLYYTLGISRNFAFPKEKVLPYWEKLYNYARRSFGETSLEAGLAAYRAGWFCQYCDLDAMKIWLEDRAYPILKKNRDRVPVEFPHTITNIADCYRKKHDIDPKREYLEAALRYCDEALCEVEKSYNEAVANGNTSVERRTYIMTAGVYMVKVVLGLKTGDVNSIPEALDFIAERITPDMASDYAYSVELNAHYHFKLGDIEKSASEYEDALERYKAILPETNSYSTELHCHLAKCMDILGKHELASEHWKTAYRMADILLVREHPLLKKIKANLTE